MQADADKVELNTVMCQSRAEKSHHLFVLLDVQSSFDDEILLFPLRVRLRCFTLREWFRRRSLLARLFGRKRHGNLQDVGPAAISRWRAVYFLKEGTARSYQRFQLRLIQL